ncbi:MULTISPECIES: hypothetical protein [Streptomyces]|nr:hypothetical protein [Streptomyces sp. SID685]
MLKVFQYGGLGDAYEFYGSPQEATRQAPPLAQGPEAGGPDD